MKRIVVVEDESSIAETIVYALKTEGYDVEHCLTGGAGCEAARTADLVVLDVGLPDMSGFDVCRELRRSSEVPVIFLTARSDEIDRVVGLELGADDYVVKPFSPRELAARVKAVLRRSAKTAGEAPSAGALQLDDQRKEISLDGGPLPLAPNEYRILALLMSSPGRTYSRRQIMEAVWEEPDFSMERTVDTHIKTLRSKLRSVRDEEVIETQRGFGYRLRSDL